MKPRSRGLALGLLAASLVAAAVAHDSPEHVVARLNERIARDGVTPELLVARGDEWRALGEAERADDDYRAALASAPGSLGALLGLGRVAMDRGDAAGAASAARRGLEASATPDAAAPFHVVHAEALEALGRDREALAEWNAAIRSERAEVDWILAHARVVRRIEGPRASAAALGAASDRNPSAVLERAWIDALLESGDVATAAPVVERRLEAARWKASWLIVRARLRQAEGDLAAARADGRRAEREIESRLGHGESPRLSALLVQARALELLPEERSAGVPPR